jgi:hypothetical protein
MEDKTHSPSMTASEIVAKPASNTNDDIEISTITDHKT